MLHRPRRLFIRPQTAVINAIPAKLGELGIVAPAGCKGVVGLLDVPSDKPYPMLRAPVSPLLGHSCTGSRGRS
jgi:hypothetical protein